MLKRPKRVSNMPGLAPGAVVHVGEERTAKVKISVIDYDASQIKEKILDGAEKCIDFKNTETVSWINIDGIHDTGLIENIGKCYDLHPLIPEDIVNTTQRPKFEDYDSCIFIVLKMLSYNEKNKEIESEQVSLVLGRNFVLSFQETEGDVFDPIRNRIKNAKSRIRSMGADYLAYSLLDAVIDNYFAIIEKLGERIEDMEEDLMNNPTPKTLRIIHTLKRDMIFLRKSVWPLREVVNNMERGDTELIKDPTRIFLRDVYDHTIQVIDSVETFRDTVSGMLDIYLSSISNKMNEVMKVLTIIATIFIPTTFIAGIYGMNFHNMPELSWKYGYPAVWAVIILVILGMLAYFRRRKWL